MGYDESSDLNIFIDTVDHKAPQAVTAEDIGTLADHQIAAGRLSPAIIKRRPTRPGTLQWTIGRGLISANRR
jgi:hypothetical protein